MKNKKGTSSIEDAEWKPINELRQAGVRASLSIVNLRAIQPGETKRISHDDLACQGDSYRCSLYRGLLKLRQQGRTLECYHEAPHIMIVRRLK